MDTSETYIKMRLAAIPDLGKGAVPIFPSGATPYQITPSVFVDACGNYFTYTGSYPCQLERQDQLQAMIDKWDTPAGMFINGVPFIASDDEYYNAQDDKDRKYYLTFQSWEQLWLAFVQKELHNKVWEDEKWQ